MEYKGRDRGALSWKKDGSISHVKVTRSVDPVLDAEAVRIVKRMQNGFQVQTKRKKCGSEIQRANLFPPLINSDLQTIIKPCNI